MEKWLQERPTWCSHLDCLFRRRVMDNLCGGVLKSPEPHSGDKNTHRICIREPSSNPPICDLQINHSDIDWFRWVLDALDGKQTSWFSHHQLLWCNDCSTAIQAITEEEKQQAEDDGCPVCALKDEIEKGRKTIVQLIDEVAKLHEVLRKSLPYVKSGLVFPPHNKNMPEDMQAYTVDLCRLIETTLED